MCTIMRRTPTGQRVSQSAADDRHLPLDEESEAVWTGHANPFLGQFGRLVLKTAAVRKTEDDQ